MFPSDINEVVFGVESQINEIQSLLNYQSKDAYTLGIWGMGGIGKTTIARALFSKISSNFQGSFFTPSIREESEKIGGLAHLRGELLSTLLDDENLTICNPSFDTNSGSQALCNKKILIVFDDVTRCEQIECLVGSLDWFMLESLIVITTRNKQVLKNCGVKEIYKMKELVNADALKLFSWHAFRQNHPNVGYEELSNKVMHYAQGVPLALRVLGRSLFGRSKEVWESEIGNLKELPQIDILKALKISYEGLDDEEQNIFLHIACFLKDNDRDIVTKFLNASGFAAVIGISILVDHCLIHISENKVIMHDLLQQMGRDIVRQSQLQHYEDICGALTHTKVDLEKIFVIINFVLELPAAAFDQLSSEHKPRFALVNMLLSFVTMLLCIGPLIHKCHKEKVAWKRKSTLLWLYYPSDKPFGNFVDIIGLVCAICQCIFATITYDFHRRHANSPVKISFWPIVFALGLLCSKFLGSQRRGVVGQLGD